MCLGGGVRAALESVEKLCALDDRETVGCFDEVDDERVALPSQMAVAAHQLRYNYKIPPSSYHIHMR